MSLVVEDADALRSSFERFAVVDAGDGPGWLRERRAAALARYRERGLPTPRDEAWRHTPVAPLARAFEAADPSAAAPREALGRVPRDTTAGIELVFVNGRFSPGLSRPGADGGGVRARSLRDALRHEAGAVEPLLGAALPAGAGVFAHLNTAFAEDGALVTVEPGAVVAEPIHLVHVAAPGSSPSAVWPRTLVLAGRGSRSTLVETFVGPDHGEYLVGSVSELVLEPGARLDRCKLQREGASGLHLATLAARLGRDARLSDHAVSLGAALARNEIEVVFDGEGGECQLDGLFAADGDRVSDTHSRVDHARPHCASRQLYKGILDGRARGVFDGLVLVRQGAQKTDAAQTNRNLLLSREALVHSTPRLEILADDVKCKHGSTTGQLDPAALFYLRSRGIGEAAARSLLTWAFAGDLLRRVPVEAVRSAAEHHLRSQLPGVAEVKEALS